MNRLLRENLELFVHPSGEQIRCVGCLHVYGPATVDWRKNAKRRLLPPTEAGPYREEMLGHY